MSNLTDLDEETIRDALSDQEMPDLPTSSSSASSSSPISSLLLSMNPPVTTAPPVLPVVPTGTTSTLLTLPLGPPITSSSTLTVPPRGQRITHLPLNYNDKCLNDSNVPRLKSYPESSQGPYTVFFRPKHKPLNVMQISKDLHRRYSSIQETRKISHDRLRVIVENRRHANEIVNDQLFLLEYQVNIPSNQVEIDGVISDRNLDPMTLSSLGVGRWRNRLLDSVPILDSRRLHDVTIENNMKKYTVSAFIRVTFEGNALPDYVEIERVLFSVRLYSPKPMYCERCK